MMDISLLTDESQFFDYRLHKLAIILCPEADKGTLSKRFTFSIYTTSWRGSRAHL